MQASISLFEGNEREFTNSYRDNRNPIVAVVAYYTKSLLN